MDGHEHEQRDVVNRLMLEQLAEIIIRLRWIDIKLNRLLRLPAPVPEGGATSAELQSLLEASRTIATGVEKAATDATDLTK